MVQLSKIREKERKLLQEKERAETRWKRTRTQLNEAERKADNHKKIVYGAVLLSAIEAGDMPAHLMTRLVEKHASERDKTLFAGTPFAVAEAVPESAGTEAPDADARE